MCYAYKQDRKKLDPRCEKGVFDKNSPAHLVYYPHTRKVLKHRLVKFITKNVVEHETQTDLEMTDDAHGKRFASPMPRHQIADQTPKEDQESNLVDPEFTLRQETDNRGAILTEDSCTRYPRRDRIPPKYLNDYVSDVDSEDQLFANLDYCYRMVCSSVPQTFGEAMDSPKSLIWADAMKEEISSLKENNTYTLTTLPKGKTAVGFRWVYAVKSKADESETYKVRYVAKGYNQVARIDYKKTLSNFEYDINTYSDANGSPI